jgi:enoyl-CoA hydratase
MSLAGVRVDAGEALRLGLAVQVVPHEQLLATAYGMAREVAGRDPALIAAIRSAYDAAVGVPTGAALASEQQASARWRRGPGRAVSWPGPPSGGGTRARPA